MHKLGPFIRINNKTTLQRTILNKTLWASSDLVKKDSVIWRDLDFKWTALALEDQDILQDNPADGVVFCISVLTCPLHKDHLQRSECTRPTSGVRDLHLRVRRDLYVCINQRVKRLRRLTDLARAAVSKAQSEIQTPRRQNEVQADFLEVHVKLSQAADLSLGPLAEFLSFSVHHGCVIF